jgi:hypothetical protein
MVGSVLGTTSLDCGLLPRSTNVWGVRLDSNQLIKSFTGSPRTYWVRTPCYLMSGNKRTQLFAIECNEVTVYYATDEFSAGVSTTRLFGDIIPPRDF